MATNVNLPEGFVLDEQVARGLPEGFVIDPPKRKFEYKPSFGQRAMELGMRATQGLYEATRYMPTTQMLGNITGAEDISKDLGLPSDVAGQVAYGVGSLPGLIGAGRFINMARGLPLLGKVPLAAEALGFGEFEGVKALLSGEPERIPEAAMSGVISAPAYAVGAGAGANVLRRVPGTMTKISPRLGSAAGAAGVSALMAPEDERVSSSILGAGFGAAFPGKRFEGKQPKKGEFAGRAGAIYREILRPSKSEIEKIDIKKRGDINKYYRLAAEEKLPIESIKEGEHVKLDTAQAREALEPKIASLGEKLEETLKLNDVLMRNKSKRFSLADIGRQAKQMAIKEIPNSKERADAFREIDSYVKAEVKNHGSKVDGFTLNQIKRGMWSVGFKQMQPTAKANARRVGRAARQTIERAYTGKDIGSVNKKMGEYETLMDLLENAHGRTVPKTSSLWAAGIGALAGSKVPIVGPLAGAYVGRKANQYLSSPKFLTEKAAKYMEKESSLKKKGLPLDVKAVNALKKKIKRP